MLHARLSPKARSVLAAALCLTLMAATAAHAAPQGDDPAASILVREIERLAAGAGGVVGASALHLQTGRTVSVRGGQAFPMASTYKVPIAVQLLHRVDLGDVKLDAMVPFEARDLHPGSGTLSDLFNKPGLALSVRNLLELMLLISDNSATDAVLRLAGGPAAVTRRMKSLQMEGIRVDRPTALLIANWAGIDALPPESEWSPALFRQLLGGVSAEDRKAAAARFETDPRDTATPDAMVALLAAIYRGQALGPESTELLMDILRRCRTGETRLKGLLPAGTEVAHKTGTIGGTTNDVGIVTLPQEAGHVAIAVLVRGSDREVSVRERVIAEIARAVHDFFLFQPRPVS